MHAKIDLLGPVQVRVADRICIPSGVRLQCALALLAIRPREVIQRDELIEELGLNETTKDTINALHAHVRRLRQWLDNEGATSNILQSGPLRLFSRYPPPRCGRASIYRRRK
ncbi:AfsR/SARP family transcriptional regulator [Mycobacteroides abscessus]|uniref:AfsR/SARP family transcriptional regulator n=1 Tax=Mycobacteroides abscessus TaxID=36809 RepID=UPI000D3E2EFD|nr:winged helix-turn-helix domain-containing protein [Mycobacteroides abscessus]PVB25673.1 hypothetical protein DDJ45_15515 [Mycobacteroides abscessus]